MMQPGNDGGVEAGEDGVSGRVVNFWMIGQGASGRL